MRSAGEIVGIYYTPDDESFIHARLRELINADADLLIITGGMSVDPDDVSRFAVRNLGATDITYALLFFRAQCFLSPIWVWMANFNSYHRNSCMRYVRKENDLRSYPSPYSYWRKDWQKRTRRARTRRAV